LVRRKILMAEDDFDLDAFLDETLDELEDKPEAAQIKSQKMKVSVSGCVGNELVSELDGIYSVSKKVNDYVSFRKEEPNEKCEEHFVLWFTTKMWVISLESQVNSLGKEQFLTICLQEKEYPYQCTKVWEVWDPEKKEYIKLESMEVKTYSDCPMEPFVTSLFSSVGVEIAEDEPLEDALKILEKETNKLKDESMGDEDELKSFLDLLMGDSGVGNSSPMGDMGGDFETTLMKWMQMLLKKDVLHEPIQIINQKFPAYLEKNKATLSEEQYQLYVQQHEVVKEIGMLLNANENPDMNAVLQKFNSMMEITSFPQELLSEVFDSIGVDLSDMNNLTSGASDFLNMDNDEQGQFNNLANFFFNQTGMNDNESANETDDPNECMTQ